MPEATIFFTSWAQRVLLVILLAATPTSTAFMSSRAPVPSSWPPRIQERRVGTVLQATPGSRGDAGGSSVDNEEGAGSSSRSGTGLAVAQRPSQYDAVMDKLPVDERYNLLLQGRCTKLVEVLGGGGKRQAAQEGSQGAAEMRREFGSLFELMKEMTGKSIRCSGKTFSTLVDAASLSRDMSVMHDCLMLARKNGVCRAFSRDVQAISLPPRDKRALQGLSPLPEDRRSLEVGAGMAALVGVGGSMGYEAVGPLFDADTLPATLLLALLTVYGLFDVTRGGGESVKVVMSGLNRLFLRDPEREARVQAATFLSAYLLGLPCFCFSPNVLEAVRLGQEVEDLSGLLSSREGLHRLLVYLLAPVAAEEAKHVQLIASDPRQARALLSIFRDRSGLVVDEEAALLWAYHEAKKLLQANSQPLDKLRKRMESGGATVGDCVALLESQVAGGGMGGWLSS